MRGALKGLEKVGVLARLMPEAVGWVEVIVGVALCGGCGSVWCESSVVVCWIG